MPAKPASAVAIAAFSTFNCQARAIAASALRYLSEPVFHCLDQCFQPPSVTQQIILNVGISADYPQITQDFEQHSCRDASTPHSA
jgi:hypothetical protein